MVRSLADRTFQPRTAPLPEMLERVPLGLLQARTNWMPRFRHTVIDRERQLCLRCLFRQITTRGEGGRVSACLPASYKKKFYALFGPKLRFSLNSMQGDENMVSRKNARHLTEGRISFSDKKTRFTLTKMHCSTSSTKKCVFQIENSFASQKNKRVATKNKYF